MLNDGEYVLRIRTAFLQLESTEYVRVPATDAKHVFIIREALDISRFQTGSSQQKFGLVDTR